jgi:hypothetical protein
VGEDNIKKFGKRPKKKWKTTSFFEKPEWQRQQKNKDNSERKKKEDDLNFF